MLELGNNSEPVQLDNESVIVLRVNKHLRAEEKTLAEVRTAIAEKLALNKAKVEAMVLGKELLGATDNLSEQEKLIKVNNLKWSTVLESNRDTDLAPKPINDMAFGLSRVGAEVGRSMSSGDYILVQLKKINDGKLIALDKEQMASITQQIEASYGMMDYDLYVNELVRKANIVKH